MGVQLYAPYIDNKLPAFKNTSTVTIKVPFQMNRTVGDDQIDDFAIIVKTVSTNTVKIDSSVRASNFDIDNGMVTFRISNTDGKFITGQYYKVQIAYVNDGTVGHFSTPAIVKCTGDVTIDIEGFISNKEKNKHSYTGTYQNSDINEKVYNYEFNIYNNKHELYTSSGKLIHNGREDEVTVTPSASPNTPPTTEVSSFDTWELDKDLIPGEDYTIEYKVFTVNDLEDSKSYTIYDPFTIAPPDFNGELRAKMYRDDGYMELSIHSTNSENLNGNFILSRASSEDNFNTWNRIYTFTLANNESGLILYRDFTIKQGVTYLYAIQMKNNNIYSSRIYNKEYKIIADFDDMFLFDGERQLRIQFNPKVSSFKTTLLETKTDTIGGKYPFFFRNGNVGYKEFAISGLLSVLTDDNHFFISNTNSINQNRMTTPVWNLDGLYTVSESNRTSLTPENFEKERNFKMEALEWLTNGKPKLFRSPGEGNYIVRLMNTSLSPNDQLGRMLHTFSSTAYQIADGNFDDIKANKFLAIDKEVNYGIKNQKIDLSSSNITPVLKNGKVLTLPAKSKKVSLVTVPKSTIKFKRTTSDETRVIPESGVCVFDEDWEIKTITFDSERYLSLSQISFTYTETPSPSSFDNITDVVVISKTVNNNMIDINRLEPPVADLMPRWNYSQGGKMYKSEEFYYIEIKHRPFTMVYKRNNKYYNMTNNQQVSWNELNFYYVVQDYDNSGRAGWTIDGTAAKAGDIYNVQEINCTCIIKTNDNLYDYSRNLTNSDENISLQHIGVVKSFVCGNGLLVDVIYQERHT